MNLDQIDAALIGALPWLAATVFPVLLILAAVFGTEWYRLGDENVHDVSDYAPTPGSRLIDVGERRRLRRRSETPIADEVAALPMSDETAHAIARKWLEEIAAVEQAKTDDVIWNSRATDRDMTGSFPVVAVA